MYYVVKGGKYWTGHAWSSNEYEAETYRYTTATAVAKVNGGYIKRVENE